MTPAELVLRVAAATEGAAEVGANAGPYVERVLKRTGVPKGNPWCAAYVADVGVCALGDRWPLPKTAACLQLGEFARRKTILNEKPMPGDVFLLWYPKLGRFAHTGFVTDVVDSNTVKTIEGNTNADGSRDGWLVARKTRDIGPNDRFVRWSLLVEAA